MLAAADFCRHVQARHYSGVREHVVFHGEDFVMKRIFTKGNVEVQNINVGDIHYEYEYGSFIKSMVLTLPQVGPGGSWSWRARNVNNNKEIEYLVTEGLSHYGPNLYDYEAYAGCRQI